MQGNGGLDSNNYINKEDLDRVSIDPPVDESGSHDDFAGNLMMLDTLLSPSFTRTASQEFGGMPPLGTSNKPRFDGMPPLGTLNEPSSANQVLQQTNRHGGKNIEALRSVRNQVSIKHYDSGTCQISLLHSSNYDTGTCFSQSFATQNSINASTSPANFSKEGIFEASSS